MEGLIIDKNELLEVLQQMIKVEVEFIGISGWMDSAILTEAGIPTAIFGPSGEGLHAEVEYVDFESVIDTAKVLAGTIVEFCNS